MSPLQPSFIIFSMVSVSFRLASAGIRYSLLCRLSLTSSLSDLPNISELQIFTGSSSNCLSRYRTKSSDCYSLPTRGVTSAQVSIFIICTEGADALSLTPCLPLCLTICGSSRIISSIVGITIPYPFSITSS